jgi:hypothetical protein
VCVCAATGRIVCFGILLFYSILRTLDQGIDGGEETTCDWSPRGDGRLWVDLKQIRMYRGADKSLARPGRKQATATEDFEFHKSYL